MVSEIIQLCRGNALLERDKTCSFLYAGHSHHHVDPRVTVHPQSKKQGYTLTQACFRRCRLCPILLFNQHREECHAQLSFLSMSSLFLRLFTSFAADAGPLNQVGILGYVKPNTNNQIPVQGDQQAQLDKESYKDSISGRVPLHLKLQSQISINDICNCLLLFSTVRF